MEDNIKNLMRRQMALQKAILKLTHNLSDVQSQLNIAFLNRLNSHKEYALKPNDVMTASDVCKMLGISPSTLRRMELYKGLPYMRIPGQKKLIFSRKEILNYLKQHKAN